MIVAITIVIAVALWIISRRTAVTAKDLDRTHVTPEKEAEGAFEREVPRPRPSKGRDMLTSQIAIRKLNQAPART